MIENKKIENPNYPTIGINSTAKILEDQNGYWWEIMTHIEGPDDLTTMSSEVFDRKDICTMDMWANFTSTIKNQLKELGE